MSADLRLYNSLTRTVEAFQPREAKRVGMYSCGPTVYNHAHIGNFRSFLYGDLLRRTLRHFGFSVTSVMNFTDVDDKTIRGSRAAGEGLRAFTDRHITEFRRDMEILNITPHDEQPRATDHIPEMVALIGKLIGKGLAYVSGNGADSGSVYFRVAALPDYGKLSHLDKEGLKPGARVAQDEYEKETLGDFALWKAWTEDDGDVAWESPWGKGRPGWHIECSAMAMRYLGEELDLHCGGIDLLFPHHENEIAQSEGATGRPFARCWGHSAHLLVDSQKMSKSLGNLFTVRDVEAKGFTGRQLRYVLVKTHYRQSLNFTWAELEAASTALTRVDNWIVRWKAESPERFMVTHPDGKAFLDAFSAALADDLNISGALGHLFDFIRETNNLMDQKKPLPDLPAIWEKIDAVLGLGILKTEIPPEIAALGEERLAARAAKDWKKSDAVRDELARLGWSVRDSAKGQELVKK
ncbi:cysteinyl-tRNA synthetase [Verrucomicrobium sp. GAS474]|uniref:cysteine--tRNA ligase n=1 Tax=Verrucomicrobium sp. GAS474 TaxID=1882831 RepID=UPI00087C9DE0|nr:cysteine--tRNA ligase [Verrucomicrobium sp. GAS474]SDU17356.1 cysteinyl-tRNA synthetase [Verrucomicrobium sp. GAS474]